MSDKRQYWQCAGRHLVTEHIQLGEIQFLKPGPIQMLLGAEHFWELAGNGTIYLGKSSQVQVQHNRLANRRHDIYRAP
jgi:hypothetical protein